MLIVISYPLIFLCVFSTIGFTIKGLVKIVEDVLRQEHATRPNKPIYLVGDSFGGCMALAVAARNPSLDLVLVLVNPGQ